MKKVLVVVDMQQDFIDGTLGTKEAKSIVDKVNRKINSFDGVIYCTQDTHGSQYMQTMEGKNLPVLHCLRDSAGWMLEESVLAAAKDAHAVLFEKNTFGSLELCRELAKLDRKDGIQEIELVGICTDICVITNAILLKTFLPEVLITVDANCCAGVTPQSHTNALDAMKMCQIRILA